MTTPNTAARAEDALSLLRRALSSAEGDRTCSDSWVVETRAFLKNRAGALAQQPAERSGSRQLESSTGAGSQPVFKEMPAVELSAGFSLMTRAFVVELYGVRLSTAQLAHLLGVSQASLYNQISSGTCPVRTYLDGGKRYADFRDVADHLDACRARAA